MSEAEQRLSLHGASQTIESALKGISRGCGGRDGDCDGQVVMDS